MLPGGRGQVSTYGIGLRSDVDVVALRGAVDYGGVAERLGVAWPGDVDRVLDYGGVHHGESGDPESQHDSIDRWEGDLCFAEIGVDEAV